MNGEKNKLLCLSSNISDKEYENIYRIVSKEYGFSDKFIENIIKVMTLLENSKINYFMRGRLFQSVVSKITGIKTNFLEIIMDLLKSMNYIEMHDNIITLSAYGKLFLMSDNISQQVDVIRYFWEKADWSKIVPLAFHDKFVYLDARRYTACLSSRINNEKYKYMEECKGYYKNKACIADYYTYHEFLSSKSIKYIFANIIEPLGLIRIMKDSDILEFDLSQKGRKIFEYYSYGMIDEYKTMLDECWDSYDRGNFQEAYDNALNIIKVVGNFPEALNLIGCVYIKKNEYANAEEVFNLALELCIDIETDSSAKKESYAENYVSIYYNLGLCCMSMGQYFRALNIFNTIKKTVPYSIESLDEITNEVKKYIII